MALLAAGLQSSWGFSLLGPQGNGGDAWQTGVIGYGYAYMDNAMPGGPIYLGDIGAPKDMFEEFRRNVPIIYYSYDANFWTYFHSNGVAAVDSAMNVINSLTNVDKLDPNAFPLNSQHENSDASALYLTDLKSATLHLLVEQLGLAEPGRFTWTLHDRDPGPACPQTALYLVVQRNFESLGLVPAQIQYSSYVNNILYTYYIIEICAPGNPLAWTVPFSTDTDSDQNTAVADNIGDIFGGGGLQVGGFYTGLTRDDVSGLRYLYSTNNVNRESAPAGSLLFSAVTNTTGQQALFPVNASTVTGFGTYDYGAFLAAAATNAPSVMQSNYPGLVVTSSHDYWIPATNLSITSTFVPPPVGSPYGTPQRLLLVTNRSYYPLHKYVTTFANVVTNYYLPNAPAILQTVTVAPLVGAPFGSPLATNITNLKVTLKNTPAGSFYIVPLLGTNRCPVDILYTLQKNVIYTTNSLTATGTNTVTSTNTTGSSYTQNLITWYTNYTYVTLPVTCDNPTNTTGYYQGVGKVKFVRVDYDSLIGVESWQPQTNGYDMVALQGSRWVRRHFDRVVTAPEILITCSDQAEANTFNGSVIRDINFDDTQRLSNLAGPGTITPNTIFDYNKVNNAFRNGYEAQFMFKNQLLFLGTNIFNLGFSNVNETVQVQTSHWGSFDASTNYPVVYPDTESLDNLNNQMLAQVSPTSLDNGTSDVFYGPVQFTVDSTRLTAPFTWSASNLPPGLTMDSTGLLTGTPVRLAPNALVYDVTVTVTDANSNTVQWDYSLIIQ